MILINPNYNRLQKLGGFFRYVPLSVPIGVGYLAASLIKHNKKVKVFDEEVVEVVGNSDDIFDSYLQDMKRPYIFGLSCLTANIGRAHELAQVIKKKYPDSVVMFGGMHPTVLSQEVLEDENVDIVVRSEAEDIIVLLYDRIKNNKNYDDLKGISFRKDGKIVHNKNAQLPDLEKIAGFPYYLFAENSDKYELGFIASSRGCPYDCLFCSQRSISGRKYRYFPTEVVIQHMDEIINKYGRNFITFLDDAFLINKARVTELCDIIRKRGFHEKALFDCQARGDSVDEDILRNLKESGFRTINFGIETASERLMKLIDKKETVEQIKQGIRLSKKHGFIVSGTFILGLPTETKQERRAAYDLAKELSLDYVRFNNATPYPGTRLYEIAKDENRLNPGLAWENLNACGSFVASPFKDNPLAYVPLGTSEMALRRDVLKYNLFYSFSLQSILRILKQRVGPAGWLALPPKWYFKPREWIYLISFAFKMGCSFVKVFLLEIITLFKGKST